MTSYVGPGRLAEPVSFDPTVTNQWGAILNSNFTLVQDLITGFVQVSIAGLTNYTLTAANGSADQSRPLIQSYIGALTAVCNVTMPNLPRVGYAVNNTTGGFNVVLKSGSGTTAVIPANGEWYFYYCDGAGNVTLPALGFVLNSTLTNLTLTGTLSAQNLEATNMNIEGCIICTGGGVGTVQFFGNSTFEFNCTFMQGCSGNSLSFSSGIFAGGVSAAAFITTSDYRLKTIYGEAVVGSVIDSVPVHDAALRDTPWDRRPMFLAHELPEWAVHGQKDAVDITGAIVPQQVDLPSLVPALWAEVAALRKRVAELEKK